MLNKIKNNFNLIVFLGSLAALVSLVPNFISSCGADDWNKYSVISLIASICFVLAAGSLVALAYLKKITVNTTLIPLFLVFAALITRNVEYIIDKSWVNIYYLIFNLAFVGLYAFAAANNKFVKYFLFVALVRCAWYLISLVGSGGLETASVLFMLLVFTAVLYFAVGETSNKSDDANASTEANDTPVEDTKEVEANEEISE